MAKCRRTGVKRDATIGKTDYDVPRPEEEVDIFAQKDDAVIKTGDDNIDEKPLIGADGSLLTVVTRKSLYVTTLDGDV